MNVVALRAAPDVGELRRYSWLSLFTAALLVAGFAGWASLTGVSGAVIAGGALVVESSAKRVQHPDGGIVAEILARNDDSVEAGQVLVRLDDTTLRAGLQVVDTQLDESRAIEAQLIAEVGGANEISFPPELLARRGDPQVAALIAAQRDMLEARQAVRAGSIQQLKEQITQLESQAQGYGDQRQSVAGQLRVVETELADLQKLRSSQLVGQGRINDLSKDKARLEGQQADLDASQQKTRDIVAERRVMIGQVDAQFLSDALTELQKLRERMAQLLQQKIAAEDKLAHVAIIAPQAGIVHESVVNTVGGVIGPAETLMMIVPTDDALVVELKLNPLDVDKVDVGQAVTLRLPGLDPRTTPELPGRIVQVAPDLSTDARTGVRYFVARAAFDPAALTGLPADRRLISGMPVEAFVHTGDRNAFTYLMQPLLEQFFRVPRQHIGG